MDLRIAAFVTVSALAHGAAMLWPAPDKTPQLTVGGEARALRVALLSTAGTTGNGTEQAGNTPELTPADSRLAHTSAQQQKTLTQASAAKHKTKKPHHTDSTPQSVAGQNTTLLPANTTGQPASHRKTSTPQHSSTKLVSEYISAALRNRLMQHFEYPWLAQQRGWEGRVLLSLRVASNGNLSEWKVIQTSGYRTLDQSALKAVRRIQHLPQAMRWLKTGSLEVHLPVQYKLLGS